MRIKCNHTFAHESKIHHLPNVYLIWHFICTFPTISHMKKYLIILTPFKRKPINLSSSNKKIIQYIKALLFRLRYVFQRDQKWRFWKIIFNWLDGEIKVYKYYYESFEGRQYLKNSRTKLQFRKFHFYFFQNWGIIFRKIMRWYFMFRDVNAIFVKLKTFVILRTLQIKCIF